VTQSLPLLEFDIPLKLGVPEFSFITVDSKEVVEAVMAVTSMRSFGTLD
jgi:hypothetical protein